MLKHFLAKSTLNVVCDILNRAALVTPEVIRDHKPKECLCDRHQLCPPAYQQYHTRYLLLSIDKVARLYCSATLLSISLSIYPLTAHLKLKNASRQGLNNFRVRTSLSQGRLHRYMIFPDSKNMIFNKFHRNPNFRTKIALGRTILQ